MDRPKKKKNILAKQKSFLKMRKIIVLASILFFIFLSISLTSCSQNKKSTITVKPTIKVVAKEIMTNAKTCALITLDTNNRPRVRMMGTLQSDDDFTVWFGTNPKSRKVEQIKHNPEVTLYYTEEGNSGYVMIQGKAEIVNDAKEKEIHWREDWKAFYPNYPDDYMLIKVSPNWMEVVSYKHNILGNEETWEPVKVVFE